MLCNNFFHIGQVMFLEYITPIKLFSILKDLVTMSNRVFPVLDYSIFYIFYIVDLRLWDNSNKLTIKIQVCCSKLTDHHTETSSKCFHDDQGVCLTIG